MHDHIKLPTGSGQLHARTKKLPAGHYLGPIVFS
jgi:hypothetical protein